MYKFYQNTKLGKYSMASNTKLLVCPFEYICYIYYQFQLEADKTKTSNQTLKVEGVPYKKN